MLLRRGFTNLHFGEVVVTDSPSQTVAMAQTEHFTAGENPDGHAQGKKLHWLPIPAFYIKKKKVRGQNFKKYKFRGKILVLKGHFIKTHKF
jgi:hypothetical protein